MFMNAMISHVFVCFKIVYDIYAKFLSTNLNLQITVELSKRSFLSPMLITESVIIICPWQMSSHAIGHLVPFEA